MTSTDKKYRDDLIYALRLHDVPGPRIGEVVAEIESHLAETGDDPRDAFGDPKDYADRVAGALDGREGTVKRQSLLAHLLSGIDWREVPILLATAASGRLLGDGAYRLGAAENGLFGLHPLLMIVIGAAGMAAGVGWWPSDPPPIGSSTRGRVTTCSARRAAS